MDRGAVGEAARRAREEAETRAAAERKARAEAEARIETERRAREVGVRKVVGAQRNLLIGQFLSEELLMTASGSTVMPGPQ